MKAYDKSRLLALTIANRAGTRISADDANTLRRASMTLRRWAELECGDGHCWIERDEATGKPYLYIDGRYLDPKPSRYSTADRESGALRRIANVCAEHGLHYYHQTDPRGCALYVSNEPLTDTNYTNGVAVC